MGSSQDQKKMLQQKDAQFRGGRWGKYNMSILCLQVLQWKCVRLRAYQNQNPHILIDISHIKFPVLKQIFLEKNNIRSIEKICRIRMPALEHLGLQNNLIHSCRQFRKENWPCLKGIYLYNNKFCELKELTHLQVNLEIMNIENDNQDREVFSDLRWITKIKGDKLRDLVVKSQERIEQEKTLLVLKKEHLDIRIGFVHVKKYKNIFRLFD